MVRSWRPPRRGRRWRRCRSRCGTRSGPGTRSWCRASANRTPHAPRANARPDWPRSRSDARAPICPGPRTSRGEVFSELAQADLVAVAVAVDHSLTDEGDDLVDEVDPGAARGGLEGPGDDRGGQDLPL